MITTLDDLIEGYQLIGFDWRYLYVNQAAVIQSKYATKQDLLGFTIMEKYPGVENTELFKTLRLCMENRVCAEFENEFTFNDNSKNWFELRIEPVSKGIFILSIDIAERKQAEAAKIKYVKDIEEMLFMISHKIRQPVTNLIGINGMLKSSKLSQEELIKIIDFVKESVNSLDAFTKELTEFVHSIKKTQSNDIK